MDKKCNALCQFDLTRCFGYPYTKDKGASLVSIIALADLTKVTRAISSSTGTAMVYIPAMIIYLVMTAFFEFIFRRMETKFSRYE